MSPQGRNVGVEILSFICVLFFLEFSRFSSEVFMTDDEIKALRVELIRTQNAYASLRGDLVQLLERSDTYLATADSALQSGRTAVVQQRIDAVRDDMHKLLRRFDV